eukprot:comp21145_c1_seq1/m.28604 comp21145_c1_seq1/g.28604  ORF comp21145_c1_seq1/g.28604 comp21145_c1_seq1/m.28604 type:complete len:155 (-) comp21145_c1_seq1:56-520(-)
MGFLSVLRGTKRQRAFGLKVSAASDTRLNAGDEAGQSAPSSLKSGQFALSLPNLSVLSKRSNSSDKEDAVNISSSSLKPVAAAERPVVVSFKKGTVDNGPSARLERTVGLLPRQQKKDFMNEQAAIRREKEAVAKRQPQLIRANERFYRAYEGY